MILPLRDRQISLLPYSDNVPIINSCQTPRTDALCAVQFCLIYPDRGALMYPKLQASKPLSGIQTWEFTTALLCHKADFARHAACLVYCN